MNREIEREGLTELGEEQEEHYERRDDCDNAAGERTAEEILVDFRVRVQIPKPLNNAVHGGFSFGSSAKQALEFPAERNHNQPNWGRNELR